MDYYHFPTEKSLIFGLFSCIFSSKISIFASSPPQSSRKTSLEQQFLITEINTQIKRIIGIYDDINDIDNIYDNDYIIIV